MDDVQQIRDAVRQGQSAPETARGGLIEVSKEPLVSIITPSYNHAPYIASTIQSVLSQDYPHLEYIVVDGGSQDHTVDVLKQYEGRLRWVSERDRGQADAINKGFGMAQGDILAWLNSDDLYLPGAVSQAVQYFQSHPEVSLVYGDGYHIDGAGRILESYGTEPFDYHRLSERCFMCQPTVFFRAEVFRAVGPLDIGLHYCLDYEYWIRIAKRFRIGYLAAYLAASRLHMDTKTLAHRVAVHAESLDVVKRHYGRVPASWLYAYSAAYLADKLLPNLQGISKDGWAAPHVRVFLRDPTPAYAYLAVHGVTSEYGRPLALRVTVGEHVLWESVITEPRFCLRVPLGPPAGRQPGAAAREIQVHATPALRAGPLGRTESGRPAAYHCRKLALIAADGRECVVYSARKAALLLALLPGVCLWTAWRINHSVPYHEMWRQGWQLWRARTKRTLSSP